MDQLHPVHNIEREASKRVHVVRREATDKHSGNIQAGLLVARSLVTYVEKALIQKKEGIGLLNRRSSTMLEG